MTDTYKDISEAPAEIRREFELWLDETCLKNNETNEGKKTGD